MHASRVPDITEDQKLRSDDRAHLVMVLWLLAALIILGRAFYVQVIRHAAWSEAADKQYIATGAAGFDRGTVFFSHYKGELVPAAQLKTTYRIAIDPSALVSATATYALLSKHLALDEAAFMAYALKKDDPYEEVAKDVPSDIVAALRTEKPKGVMFVKDNKRTYPQEEVGAKVLGFVGNDGIRIKGQYGIERYYNDVLSRSDSRSINFFAELFADIEKTSVSNRDASEGDVVLTIDAEVERALHGALLETKSQWNSDLIGGIVMDPQTGAILAMETLPSFDPNSYSQVEDASQFMNQNVSGVYEMGSIIKPITMASAIDAGAVSEATTTYNDTGFRDLNGYKVRNFDGIARGPGTSMQTILDKSLNVGIVFLVEQLGTRRFQEYFKKFGLGEETGIDLPGEASGLTRNLESDILVDNATAGFGQGIAITPIQTIRALAALGNGGKLINPHIVDTIVYRDGTSKKLATDPPSQVIRADTSERISRMLVHVVDTALRDGTYKLDRYSIAAKTGTAQVPRPGGGYYEDRYLHSFFGYFPAYEPKYIIFLYHTNPKGAQYASATLTDPFFKLVKFLISYYEVPPDR